MVYFFIGYSYEACAFGKRNHASRDGQFKQPMSRDRYGRAATFPQRPEIGSMLSTNYT